MYGDATQHNHIWPQPGCTAAHLWRLEGAVAELAVVAERDAQAPSHKVGRKEQADHVPRRGEGSRQREACTAAQSAPAVSV